MFFGTIILVVLGNFPDVLRIIFARCFELTEEERFRVMIKVSFLCGFELEKGGNFNEKPKNLFENIKFCYEISGIFRGQVGSFSISILQRNLSVPY